MSAVPLETAIPAGQHAPFSTVNKNDHGAWIIVATAMGMSFSMLALMARTLIRQHVNKGWQLDDTVVAISSVLSWIQSSLILAACAGGLGKSVTIISLSQQALVQRLYYASNFLYLPASDLSKLSVVFFLRRILGPGSKELRYSTILLVLIPLSTFIFTLAGALQCDLTQPWITIGQQCPAWFLRWQIQAALSIVFEIAIFAIPVSLLWNLQTKFNSKWEIATPFALRLLVIILTAMRLVTFDSAALAINPTLREAKYICFTQAEMSYAIIAATIPTARKMMLNFITYYNAGGFGSTTGSGGRTIVESMPMGSLKPSSGRKDGSKETGAEQAGRGSQEMIIKKEVTVEVSNDTSLR